MQFITQPFGEVRLGEFLLNHFADPQWTAFRAAVAFVKRSGTQHVRRALRDFSARSEVRISVGVDLYGTSTEGLRDLLEATREGQVFVYRNNGPYTFHPKVYLFKSAQRADVLVGSGNMTGGGLFTNYEASLTAALDLIVPADRAFLEVIEARLNTWSQPQQGTCYTLTAAFIDQLVALGLVRSEAELAAMQPRPPATATGAPAGRPGPAPPPLFVAVTVPQAPRIAREAAETVEAEAPAETAELPSATVVPPPGIVPMQTGGLSCFVMTLQNTDVGVGQITRGTSRRSPEVFIPLAAIDQNTAFWTFPNQFVADRGWNARNPGREGTDWAKWIACTCRCGSVLYKPFPCSSTPTKVTSGCATKRCVVRGTWGTFSSFAGLILSTVLSTTSRLRPRDHPCLHSLNPFATHRFPTRGNTSVISKRASGSREFLPTPPRYS